MRGCGNVRPIHRSVEVGDVHGTANGNVIGFSDPKFAFVNCRVEPVLLV